MQRSHLWIGVAIGSLGVGLILSLIGFLLLPRLTPTPDGGPVAQVNTHPEQDGLIVVLNDAPDADAVLVQYVSPGGVAARTRYIPNITADGATAQVVQDDLFVFTPDGDEAGIRRMDESGSLSAGPVVDVHQPGKTFWLVAPDGATIVWSQTAADHGIITNTLWSARVDGADPEVIAEHRGTQERYIRPLQWVSDATGRGSPVYVLHSASRGDYTVYDNPTGVLFQNDVRLLPQGAYVDFNAAGVPITLLDGTPKSLLFQNRSFPLVDAGHAGTVRLSPTEGLLAVSISRGLSDPEETWVEVWDVVTQQVTRIYPLHPADFLEVVEWLDEDTVVLQETDGAVGETSRVLVVNADGSFLREVWRGRAVGVVPGL